MEELNKIIRNNQQRLPALSVFWEIQQFPIDTRVVISSEHNTSYFRPRSTYKAISTTVDLSIIIENE